MLEQSSHASLDRNTQQAQKGTRNQGLTQGAIIQGQLSGVFVWYPALCTHHLSPWAYCLLLLQHLHHTESL